MTSLTAAKAFIELNERRIPAIAEGTAKEMLDKIIENLVAGVLVQQTGDGVSRDAKARYRAARMSLIHDFMMPMNAIAKISLPNDQDTTLFRMPRGNPHVHQLIAHARAFMTCAQPVRVHFLAAGLPSDFFERMEETIVTMHSAFKDVRAHKEGAMAQTHTLPGRFSEGRNIIRALDRLIARESKHDPSLLAEWRAVIRVDRTPVHRLRAANTDTVAMLPAAPAPEAEQLEGNTTEATGPNLPAPIAALRRLLPGRLLS